MHTMLSPPNPPVSCVHVAGHAAPVGCGDDGFHVCVRIRLQDLVLEASTLSGAQVQRALCVPVTSRRALQLDPGFLAAVASGTWTAVHQAVASDAQRWSVACARQHALLFGRWGLAAALWDAALVVISDTDAQRPLPPSLRTRLAAPWLSATGHDPGRWLDAPDVHRVPGPRGGESSLLG